jgi:hypothetical protein
MLELLHGLLVIVEMIDIHFTLGVEASLFARPNAKTTTKTAFDIYSIKIRDWHAGNEELLRKRHWMCLGKRPR